jgi:hypothetical protein
MKSGRKFLTVGRNPNEILQKAWISRRNPNEIREKISRSG